MDHALIAAQLIVDHQNETQLVQYGNGVTSQQLVKLAEAYIRVVSGSYTIVDLFAVHEGDSDRDAGHPKWYFDTELQANDVAQGRGWYGSNAPIAKVKALRIGDEAYLLSSSTPIDVNLGPQDDTTRRLAALAKLSDFDKKILGLQ